MLDWAILRNLARKCGMCGGSSCRCKVQNVILWFLCSRRVPLQTRLYFFGHCILCARFEVLKVVFQADTAVLPKLRMSLLGRLGKGLTVLDLTVVTVLTTWSPVATERCWWQLMIRPYGVQALSPGRKWHRRIAELHLKEFVTFIFSVSYKLKSRFGIQSFLQFSYAVQQVDTTILIYLIGNQKVFRALFWPFAVKGCTNML
jgi:hypothetical protein